MARSALVCLESANTGLGKFMQSHANVISPPARTELDAAAASIADARAGLTSAEGRALAIAAMKDAYRRLVEIRTLATGPGLQVDLDAVIGDLEEASDDLNEPLFVPEK
jgi:hypothetical protein